MAQKFRKIDPRIWRDEKFIGLTPDEKLVALYCLTAQSNRCGLFVFSPAMAAEELGTSPPTFQGRFRKVVSALRWEWDEVNRVLYFPTWWKYNQPDHKNILIGCLRDLSDLPQTQLLSSFIDNTRYLPETLHPTLKEGCPQPQPNHPPSQEQEQEQEQEQDKRRQTFTPPTLEQVSAYCLERGNHVDPERFVDFYASKGWKVGDQSMKDWQAAVRTWEKNATSKSNGKPSLDELNARMAAKYGSGAKAVPHE